MFQFLAFATVVGIPVDIASSAMGLTICVITAGIKTYKSIIRKKRKRTYNGIFSKNLVKWNWVLKY